MTSINTYHNSKWRLVLSNIPTLSKNKDVAKMYENTIKSVTIPDYNIENLFIDFKNERHRESISRRNDNLTPIILEFKVNEDLTNYINLFEYMQELRFGSNPDRLIKDNTIDTLNVMFLNNQGKDTYKIYFTKVSIEGLSSLPLVMGDDSEITFTVTFTYRDMLFAKVINN